MREHLGAAAQRSVLPPAATPFTCIPVAQSEQRQGGVMGFFLWLQTAARILDPVLV